MEPLVLELLEESENVAVQHHSGRQGKMGPNPSDLKCVHHHFHHESLHDRIHFLHMMGELFKKKNK